MFSLVEKRRLYFLFSGIVLLAGMGLILFTWATNGTLFRLSNDFVGGSLYEFAFITEGTVNESSIRDVFIAAGENDATVQRLGQPEARRWSVRTGFVVAETNETILAGLRALAPLDAASLRIEQVSASVGQEVAQSAFLAVLAAAVVITGFIVIAFRQVPDAFRYGVCAIAAMLHDVLVVCGFVSLMGILAGWEIDALFLTALLTVVGFSVQDTIVLFDRIRENIPTYLGEPYETIINRSILETIHRSLATQLNAFFIMIAILLFGGDSIKQFIATLFVGLISGTYSSIFIAVPLLVAWEKGELPLISRRPMILKDDVKPVEA